MPPLKRLVHQASPEGPLAPEADENCFKASTPGGRPNRPPPSRPSAMERTAARMIERRDLGEILRADPVGRLVRVRRRPGPRPWSASTAAEVIRWIMTASGSRLATQHQIGQAFEGGEVAGRLRSAGSRAAPGLRHAASGGDSTKASMRPFSRPPGYARRRAHLGGLDVGSLWIEAALGGDPAQARSCARPPRSPPRRALQGRRCAWPADRPESAPPVTAPAAFGRPLPPAASLAIRA